MTFPKPTKKVKVKKRVNRVKKTPLAKLKRMADTLAGAKCRARGKCEVCGSLQGLQWCHIMSRRYLRVRWLMSNCLCLCSKCHMKYTYNPTLWVDYLITNRAKQYSLLINLREQFDIKINREFLERTIGELK